MSKNIRMDLEGLIERYENLVATADVDSILVNVVQDLQRLLAANPEPVPSNPYQMVRIEGKQLQSLIEALTGREYGAYLLRLNWRDTEVAYKVNEGTWSPGVGTVQEPY